MRMYLLVSAAWVMSAMSVGQTPARGDDKTDKYPAPQATLMATLIQGLLAFNLDWQFVLVGVSRTSKTPALLAKLITDKNISENDKSRYLRALDFIKGPEKEAALLEIATSGL